MRTGEIVDNKMDAETEKAQAAFGAASGSVTLTYAELEAVLQNCRWGIESAPGEDPPAGYEALPPEQAEIADACWHRGMEQLSTALLNYWYDHGAAPVSPNDQAEAQCPGEKGNNATKPN